MNFNSKTEYIQWRSAWKQRYAEISQDSRALKVCRRERHRAYAKTHDVSIYFVALPAIEEAHQPIYAAMAKKYTVKSYFSPEYDIDKLRREATQMLELLKQAKIEAQRQYLAEHQAVQA